MAQLREAANRRADNTIQRGDRPRKRRGEGGGRPAVTRDLINLKIGETRDASGVDGGNTDPGIGFFGHASVVETPYEMWDFFGPYTEVISDGAFTDTLARKDLDVPLVLGHDQMRRVARTTNGSLNLSMDEVGLAVEATLDPEDMDVQAIVPKLRSGLISEMSFMFRINSGQWSPDYQEYRITSVDLHRGDVSIVGYGANPSTEASLTELKRSVERIGKARALLELHIVR